MNLHSGNVNVHICISICCVVHYVTIVLPTVHAKFGVVMSFQGYATGVINVGSGQRVVVQVIPSERKSGYDHPVRAITKLAQTPKLKCQTEVR